MTILIYRGVAYKKSEGDAGRRLPQPLRYRGTAHLGMPASVPRRRAMQMV